MADSNGIQRGLRLKNRNGKDRLVVLDAQPADEWLAGDEEKYTCEQPNPARQSNRTCWYARISLAVQESDGNICREEQRRSLWRGNRQNEAARRLARGLLKFSP